MSNTTARHELQVGDWVSAPDVHGDEPWIGEIVSRDSLPDYWRVEYEIGGAYMVNVEHESALTFVGTERPEEV